MSTRFVVLLRGVNVGKGHRVPMAELKTALQGLGYTGVSTLLNSGNAVFCSAAPATGPHGRAIAALLQQRFGITTPVIVKTAAELSAIVDGNPLAPAPQDHPRCLVVFAQEAASLLALAESLPPAQAPERLVLTSQAGYLHCPLGILDSRLATALLGKAGKLVTTRNWSTVLKLHALCQAG
jgi:uncharacterized protein (DUF1697 family)